MHEMDQICVESISGTTSFMSDTHDRRLFHSSSLTMMPFLVG